MSTVSILFLQETQTEHGEVRGGDGWVGGDCDEHRGVGSGQVALGLVESAEQEEMTNNRLSEKRNKL